MKVAPSHLQKTPQEWCLGQQMASFVNVAQSQKMEGRALWMVRCGMGVFSASTISQSIIKTEWYLWVEYFHFLFRTTPAYQAQVEYDLPCLRSQPPAARPHRPPSPAFLSWTCDQTREMPLLLKLMLINKQIGNTSKAGKMYRINRSSHEADLARNTREKKSELDLVADSEWSWWKGDQGQ